MLIDALGLSFSQVEKENARMSDCTLWPQKETLRQKYLELVKKNPENSVSLFTATAWVLTVFNFASNSWISIQFKFKKKESNWWCVNIRFNFQKQENQEKD